MINDITIGQYYPTDSVIHKLDPRTKIVSAFLYIIFLFTVNNVWGYLAAFIFLAAVVIVSKIPAGYVIKGIKGILFIMLLTVVINMFWTPGEIVWQWKFLKITKEGIQLSFNMAFRLVLLISGTSIMPRIQEPYNSALQYCTTDRSCKTFFLCGTPSAILEKAAASSK